MGRAISPIKTNTTMKDLDKRQLQQMQKMTAKVANVCAEFCAWYNNSVTDGSIGNYNFDVLFNNVKIAERLCDDACDALIDMAKK